ncbi:MAG: rhodanese-like domain-containing protein, partial [Oscillospiraceae bacterium]|nr:rhodanese-like domain-containing protein [Oscillospiraceae bacterium]
ELVTGEEGIFIHGIAFNVDQIVGVLDGGRILSITECSVCNEEMQLEEQKDLWAAAVQEAGVLVCGEDFYSHVVDAKQIRQDKIKPDQALTDMARGALLIDVREAEELAEEGYIPGSIHIPLAEVAEKLPEVAPDHNTELIFYCKSGKRSQKATEQAVEMGYQRVYNLGGIGDWPYEIAKDDPAETP